MMGSNEYRRKRLEIRRKIDYYEEQRIVFPYSKHEADRHIEELEDELEQLAMEYRRQIRNSELF